MYLNLCRTNPSHACGDTKCILTYIVQTLPCARTQNTPQHVLTKPIPCRSAHKMHHHMRSPKPAMLSRTHNASQHVLTKILPYQRVHKLHLKMCLQKTIQCYQEHKTHLNPYWTNPYHAFKGKICITNRDDQTHPMTARTQDVSQPVLTKPISTCIDETHPMQARTQNASQHVLMKLIQCKRGHKIHLNVYRPSSYNASDGKKCISSCVDHTPSILARTQNAY